MRVCILGTGLTSLTLAKALVNQKIYVDIIEQKKKTLHDKSRTIGISKSNIEFFNHSIINLDKIAWKIKKTSWSSQAQIQLSMVKSMIPAAGVLLIIQGISEVFRSIICIQTGQWPARLVVAEETEQVLMRAAQEEDKKNVI